MSGKGFWRHSAVLAAMVVSFSTMLMRGSIEAYAQETAPAKAQAAGLESGGRSAADILKELKETLPHAKLDGKTYYFVEGDLRLEESRLPSYARDLVNQFRKFEEDDLAGLPPSGPAPGPLMLHVVNGQVMSWEPGSTLTYCVLKRTFAGDEEYKEVVANMDAATKEWAATCNIKFKHDSSKDDSIPGNVPPDGVTFTVRKVDDPGGPIASAFFPGDPQSDRHLLLFPDYFAPGLTFDKVGVIRHELGHVLGFRHEHIRSEAPAACQGEPLFEAIPATEFDPKSVMHYFCGGRGSRELKITLLDQRGSRLVYGAPVSLTGFGAAPSEKPLDADGQAKDVFKRFKP